MLLTALLMETSHVNEAVSKIRLEPNIVHSCVFCTKFYRSPKLKTADIVIDITTSTKVFKLNGHTFLLILATGILLNLSYSLFLISLFILLS